MNTIDLRSDTLTKPTPPMLEAMMRAELGDDVFGEDPTVNRLQDRIATMFGKEAALFVPSGTMGNEVCIKAHTEPGDEIIVEQNSHIFVYETGGPSLLSGVQMKTVSGVCGVVTVDQLKLAIRPHAYYLPPTKLICLENTHGLSGGSIVPLEDLRKVREFALAEKLKVHLDGARLWNACVATGISPREYAQTVDSLSVCFSKGLGAPIGSIIIGEKGFVERARKYRKVFGGGMRQAGVLAAAALYALDHHIDRLKEDHALAKYFGEELSQIKALGVDLKEVQTNMVFAEINATGKSQSEVLNLLKSNGLLMTPERHSAIRAVFHLGVSMPEVRQAVDIFRRLFGG